MACQPERRRTRSLLGEAGLKGFNIGTRFGVLAASATPREIVARLNAA